MNNGLWGKMVRLMNTDYTKLLNPAQLRAVTSPSQYIRIIAGAGSGKTRVLTYRIAYLIEEFHVDPSSILAVTFTNKAAETMKQRVAKIVPNAADFLNVSTFHSFCARFLRHEARLISYPSSFTIFDDEDSERLLKAIAEEKGYRKSDPIIKSAIRYIGKCKLKGLYPEDVNIGKESFQGEKECLSLYFIYEERKTAMLCLDFDDLILQTIRILEEHPEVREKWSHRFSHILVDEYQDTNDAQYKILRLLCSPKTCVTVVGDPDQTIYTWRGANQGIIMTYPDVFFPCEDIVLNENYRSTKNILDRANALIAHNKKRVPKDLFTHSQDGEIVTAKQFESSEEEAQWVVNRVMELSQHGLERKYRDIAILYRSSYVTLPFERALSAAGVPYRIYGGLRYYQRKEVKDVIAYFRLLANEKDDVSFERIINVPKRGIGPGTLLKLKEEAHACGLSYYEYCRVLYDHPESEVPPRAIGKLTELLNKMEETKSQLSDNLEVYAAVLKKFITDIDYYAYLVDEQAVDEDRVGNVDALFDDINHYVDAHPESSFVDYLENVALYTAQDDLSDGNYVSLMTIHVAKGLEFENVFMIAMNDGSFPSNRSINDEGRDGLEEERRLCYVAMTRAKKRLLLTCNSSYSYTTDGRAQPSRFFSEAGLKLPKDSFFSNSFSGGWGSRKPKSSWRTVGWDDEPTFQDGDSYDPFAGSSAPVVEEPKSNDIIWEIGDRLNHAKFGDGTVVEKISDTIIVVKFDDGSKKTLLGSHHLLSRLPGKGASA